MDAARLSLSYFGKISLPLLTRGESPPVRITVREKTHGTRSALASAANGSVPASSITAATLEDGVRQWKEQVADGYHPPDPPVPRVRVVDADASAAAAATPAPLRTPCTLHAEFTVKERVAFVAWVDDFSPLVRRVHAFASDAGGGGGAGTLADWGHFFMNPIVLHEVNEFLMRNRTWAFYCHYDPVEMSVVIEDGGPLRPHPPALTWGARRLHIMEMVDSYHRASFKNTASAISFDGGVEALTEAELAAHDHLYATQKPVRVVRKALLQQ
jgi:hypothetical protein